MKLNDFLKQSLIIEIFYFILGYPNRINLLGPYLTEIKNNLHIRPNLLQKVSYLIML